MYYCRISIVSIKLTLKCIVCYVQLAESCPHQCLEWLSTQVLRNKMAASWTLQNLDFWVETYLISYSNLRVRNGMPHVLSMLSLWIIIGSDRRPETKQGIEGKIDRFRSGRVRVRFRDRSEPINFGAC